MPLPLLMPLLVMIEVVFGAAWIIFAPASWCWSSPANATDRTSPCAPSPVRYTLGYFIVTLLPRFASIQLMRPPFCTTARLVTRLYTLWLQFWIVVYRTSAP